MQSDKVQRSRHGLSCLSEKPSVSGLPLLAARKAAELAAVFETLANDTRLRVLNVMAHATETSPTELAQKIGMKPQAISNQLKRLSDRGIVERRREGNQVYYRIVDPCVVDLLERGLWFIQDTKLRKGVRRKSALHDVNSSRYFLPTCRHAPKTNSSIVLSYNRLRPAFLRRRIV